MRPPRRLKFTQAGRYFTGMTLLVGFGAINTGNNLLYLLLGMTLSLIVVSGMLSEQVINRVTVRHKLPGRLFARHPAPIEVTARRRAGSGRAIVDRVSCCAHGNSGDGNEDEACAEEDKEDAQAKRCIERGVRWNEDDAGRSRPLAQARTTEPCATRGQ